MKLQSTRVPRFFKIWLPFKTAIASLKERILGAVKCGCHNKRSMFRKKLPRFYELKGVVPDPASPDCFFADFEKRFQSSHVLEVFVRWEKQFQGLDDGAWLSLREEVAPYLARKDSHRAYQQIFDILSQALAYNHLRSLGCSNVRFIPRSPEKKTPDLEGLLASGRMLCEVKTYNISKQETHARQLKNAPRKVSSRLDAKFFGKLDSLIERAKNQLIAYDPKGEARHLLYINVLFDDWLEVYRADYCLQIDQHLQQHPPGIEVVFAPPGY